MFRPARRRKLLYVAVARVGKETAAWLDSYGWYHGPEAAGVLEVDIDQVRTWRLEGSIFGVKLSGGYFYPAFQFDEEQGRVHGAIAEKNRDLGPTCRGWEAAMWWGLDPGRALVSSVYGAPPEHTQGRNQ